MTNAIQKILSRNDTGETGGHQAGILVPKQDEILSFFPSLDKKIKNPRCLLNVIDDSGEKWSFSFIYYNNRFFGGTRNEYRLTGMTRFMKVYNLKAGDELTLRLDNDSCYRVTYSRIDNALSGDEDILKIGASWKVVRI